MNSKTKAHLAVLSANLIFGINFSVVKFVTSGLLKSFGLNVARVLVTSALLWLMFLIKPSDARIKKEHWARFIICAASGVALNQMLFIKGVSMTLPIHGSLLILITPIVITFMAAWVIREKITFYKILGLILGIGGAVLLVTSNDHKSSNGSNIWLGDVFIILNAIFYSFYLVMVKKLMEEYHPLHVIRWVFTIGTLMILPFGWNEFFSASWGSFDLKAWAAIGFIVIGSTFFAYLFNLYGVRHLGASITGAYIYTQPVFAAIVATLFAGETITATKLISAALIFTGVYLTNNLKR